MDRSTWMIALGLVVLAAIGSPPAYANPARTDLMDTDTDSTLFQAVGAGPNGAVFVGSFGAQDAMPAAPNGLVQTGSGVRAGGVFFFRVIAPAMVETVTWIGAPSEPDKVNRLPDRSQAAIVQRNFATTTIQYIQNNAFQTFLQGPTAGCQAKIRYRGYSSTENVPASANPGAWTRAQGTLVCEEFALQAGIVDAATRERIKALIGTKSDGTGLRTQFTANAANLQ